MNEHYLSTRRDSVIVDSLKWSGSGVIAFTPSFIEFIIRTFLGGEFGRSIG